ncbi:hypothetical protein ACSDQ9_01340 [Aestuariimicrobium soli]|uniref:hypothetical protein n=1 Tax=Aestuariimicrobium soli TaxID=2035834 RepID=UPI003EC0ACA8
MTRRIADTAALAIMLVGTLWGLGWVGSPVEDTAGGALAADATLLAPGSPAFLIWTPIYLLLAAFVVWRWTPDGQRSSRADRLGWLPAISMILNGAWLGLTQAGWLWASVVDIALLAATLGLAMVRLAGSRPRRMTEEFLLDGTFGLYLGWVTVATCANVAAAGVGSGVTLGRAAEGVAVAVLAAATVLAVVYARAMAAAPGIGGAMAWGLGWICYGRLVSGPISWLVGIAAAVATVAVLATYLVSQTRWRPSSDAP